MNADKRGSGKSKTLPRMNTDETDGNREIGTWKDRDIGKARSIAAAAQKATSRSLQVAIECDAEKVSSRIRKRG
jgi:hypothetical protein